MMKKLFTLCWALALPILMFALSLENPSSCKQNSFKYFNLTDTSTVIHSDCPLLKRKCSGKIKWGDGSTYNGEFRFGKPHGDGTITYPDGTFYKGEFKRGFPNGIGFIEYDDGSFYKGEWNSGIKSGIGVYTFAEGHEYSGEFEDDVMNGFGMIKFLTGEIYEGDWKNGLAEGNGKFTRKDGSRFIGQSEAGQRSGEGMIVWTSGDTLLGVWDEGILVEEATYVFSDGTSMISIWEEGELQDQLTYVDKAGKEISGSLNLISQISTTKESDFFDIAGEKLPLVFYGFAMEYHAMQNFDLAEKNLDLAYLIDTPINETPYRDMVVELTAHIQSEQVNRLLGKGNVLFRF